MKILAFAALFALLQAISPIPRETTKDTSQKGQSLQGEPRASQYYGDNQTAHNEEKPVTVRVAPVDVHKDWADYLYTFAGLLLAFVTLVIADIALMQARAAKASADALINSERAWVMADLQWRDRVRIMHTNHDKTAVDLDLVCRNDGRTPAWITEARVRVGIGESLPPIPIFDPIKKGDWSELRPIPLTVSGEWKCKADCWCEGRLGFGKAIFIYGFVKYRDAFRTDRETRFGYSAYFNQEDKLDRITHPEYNKNT